jgi:hypothetical protein
MGVFRGDRHGRNCGGWRVDVSVTALVGLATHVDSTHDPINDSLMTLKILFLVTRNLNAFLRNVSYRSMDPADLACFYAPVDLALTSLAGANVYSGMVCYVFVEWSVPCFNSSG